MLYERGHSTQLHTEIIIASVGRSDPALSIPTDIIFGSNGGAKINRFPDYIENIVIGRNLRSNTKHLLVDSIYFVFPSFSTIPILVKPANGGFFKNSAIAIVPAFRKTVSMIRLKRSHDKGSPCQKPRTASKGSERSIFILTELQELLNVILHRIISFAGIPSFRHCGIITIHYRAIEGCRIADKKMVCVDLFFMGLFQDLT